jgi:limonene-1,2-epoxide hydrolase
MRTIWTLLGALLILGPLNAQAQTSSPPMTAQERRDLDVVNRWIAGWNAKNPNQVAATMADDALFTPGLPVILMERGRQRFFEENAFTIRKGVQFKMKEVLALGGSNGTIIMLRRVDRFWFIGHKWELFTNAVLFWVRNGKIELWYDIPVVNDPSPEGANGTADMGTVKCPGCQSEPEEQGARDLVNRWLAGWAAKDPDQVMSTMDDNATFSSDFPAYLVEFGKTRFMMQQANVIRQGLIRMQPQQMLLVGGPRGTGVLLKRIDRYMVDGKEVEVPNAAFFWIMNGKIQTWDDFPLEPAPQPKPSGDIPGPLLH